ncbi:MAG: ribosome maturation factor RimM [Clostridia bacterium]
MTNKIEIGKVLKPQGIKGEIKVLPLTNVLSVFDNIDELEILNNFYKIKSCNFREGMFYIKLENVDTCNQAEIFRDKKVYTNKENLNLNTDTFLINDILGFNVVNQEGEQIGKLVQVDQYGAVDNFVIQLIDRRLSAPFLTSVFCDINFDTKIITINQSRFDEVAICE